MARPNRFCRFGVNVEVQFYPWFKFYFCLFLSMVMCDYEFKTKENKIEPQDKHARYCGAILLGRTKYPTLEFQKGELKHCLFKPFVLLIFLTK